jgi:hypothetical protein
LEEPPPLTGGAASYPTFLIQGLPPADLTFVYPAHLKLFNEGYSIGWGWIVRHPFDFIRLTAKKLAIFWAGTASGLTGWNLPAGQSGIRRPVDMVTPEGGTLATTWQLALIVASAAGIVAGRRNRGLVPWLLFLATRLAVTVLFFGYARQGATAIPVVAILVALAVERWTPARVSRLAIPVLLVGVTVEATRLVSRPVVAIDGRPVGVTDPLAPDENAEHEVEVSRN